MKKSRRTAHRVAVRLTLTSMALIAFGVLILAIPAPGMADMHRFQFAWLAFGIGVPIGVTGMILSHVYSSSSTRQRNEYRA